MINPEIKKLLRELAPHKRRITIVAITGIIYSVAYSRLALMMKDLFDQLSKGDHKSILALAPLALGLAFASALSRYIHIYNMNYTSDCVVQGLRQKLQSKFMRLSLSYHNTYAAGSGGLISRILNDIRAIQDALRIVADIFLHPLLLVLLIGNLLIIDWKLTLFTFSATPIIVLVLKSIGKSMRKYWPLGQSVFERITATIKESLDGVRTIQSFNLEKEMETRMERETSEFLVIRKKIYKREVAAGPVTELVATVVVLSVLVYISWQIGRGEATPGTFIGFITSLLMLNQPMKKVQEAYIRIQDVISCGKRVYEIIEAPHEVPQNESVQEFPSSWETITYKNINFSYGEHKVLKNLNLEIKRGEVVALVGESGSGKSTIVNLLERFYDASSGEIYIGGTEIRKIDLKKLRHNIAMVSQDVFLFSDTIERNIWAGDFSKSPDGIPVAAQMANAHSFITKNPEGYQALVGDRGSLLSGGEKQRVSIARAFFKDAPILILDEATSALDTSSEIEVQKGLETLMKGRTALVIAHRLSTIQKADKIVVLKAGEVVEIGTHEELMAKQGEYARFYSLQHSL